MTLLDHQAVQHLHANSLVHMDIKPENIFLSEDGVCKLGDFGLMFHMDKVTTDIFFGQIPLFFYTCTVAPCGRGALWEWGVLCPRLRP